MKRVTVFLNLLFCFSAGLFAQSNKGKAVDKVTGTGVSATNVVVLDTTQQVTASGNYTIQIEQGSYNKDEVIVIGYGTSIKNTAVGAIAQTSGESLKTKGAAANLTDALSAAIPGVTVMIKTGAPGTTGEHGKEAEILIRGLSTWNNSQPLILVDGVQRPMSDVSIDEIENFTVLKDASATSVFGVKGANGVILITTKRGQTGKSKVSFEINTSVKSISKIEKPLESYDALVARNWAVIHEIPLMDQVHFGKGFYTSPRILGYYRDNVDPEKYTNVDWQDVMIKDQALTAKYSVNVSGGTEFVKYFTSLTYSDDGDIMNTGTGDNPRGYKSEFKYQRVNFRTNLDFKLTKTTIFKVNLSGYFSNQQTPNQGRNAFWPGLYRYSTTTPLPIYSDGTFGSDDPDKLNLMGNNHYFDLLTGGTSVQKRTALTSDFKLEQQLDFITKGLSARGSLSFDNYFTTQGSNVTDPSAYITKRFDVKTDSWVFTIPLGASNGFKREAGFLKGLSCCCEKECACGVQIGFLGDAARG